MAQVGTQTPVVPRSRCPESTPHARRTDAGGGDAFTPSRTGCPPPGAEATGLRWRRDERATILRPRNSMPTWVIATVVALVAVVALGLIARMAADLRQGGRVRRTLAAIPRTAIASVAEGMHVKVVGVVEKPQEPLRAPLTERACVAYAVRVFREPDSEDQGVRGGHEVLGQELCLDLVVRDDTGAVAVDGGRATVELGKMLELEPGRGAATEGTRTTVDVHRAIALGGEPGPYRDYRERGARWLATQGSSLDAITGDPAPGRLLFQEAMILAGDRVSVVGVARHGTGADPGLVLGCSEAHDLLVTNVVVRERPNA